jgi:hypothetical protein
MQHAAMEIDGGVNERVGGATIFGLHVIGGVAHIHVGVVTKKHGALRLFLRIDPKLAPGNFSAAFDRLPGESVL